MVGTRTAKSFNRDEQGQLSVMLVLGLIPIIFLIALIFNSAHQTTRKIELQGAADSGAVSGGVWMARGMNLTVLNNNGMAEVISVMITVRALRYTIFIMNKIVIPKYLPFIEIPAVAIYIEFLELLETTFNTVDNALSNQSGGIGWIVMRSLDKLNQIIKAVIPPIVQAEAISYAEKNGADSLSFVLSGARGASVTDLLPLMPVGRGLTRFTVERAEDCQLPKITGAAGLILIVYGPDYPLALTTFRLLVRQNVSSLKGTGGGSIPFPPPLRWPSDPPRPMILTDRPLRSPAARTNIPEENADLRRVRRFLQLLMIAQRTRPHASKIGGERFPNETPVWLSESQFTYGQADIYNPTLWSMFSQDWRAQLSKASLFEEKKNDLAKRLGFGNAGQYFDWAFINTH